jgi:hypothetical protein
MVTSDRLTNSWEPCDVQGWGDRYWDGSCDAITGGSCVPGGSERIFCHLLGRGLQESAVVRPVLPTFSRRSRRISNDNEDL